MSYANVFALLILSCAIAAALPVEIEEPETDYRLPKTTVPIHYDLKMIPDLADNFTFDGEVVARFKLLEPTEEIKLHMEELTLNENATRLVSEDGKTFTPLWYGLDNETDILKMYFGGPLESGIYTLSLEFSGVLRDDMLGFFKEHYNNSDGEKVWVAATQFEAIYARLAFPCWDEPALKATFDVSIKHHPNYTALSNMPISKQSEVDKADGKMWTHFQTTPIMSTYLVAFVIIDYTNVTNEDGTINVWGRKDKIQHLKLGHEIAVKASKELEKYTNSTVRVPKMDHVALPRLFSVAMENWGLITYGEKSFVYDENTSTLHQKFDVVGTVAHELAHQWFGNVVSPTWWSHLWLNEGFASYFAFYIVDKIYPNWKVMDYFVITLVQGSLSTDTENHEKAVDENITTRKQIDEVFSVAVYDKASSLIYMLSNIITPEVFHTGVRNYLKEHEYSSANSDCLWRALQSALDKSEVPHDDFNVKEVMDTWILQKRYPLVYVTRDYSAGTMTLSQKDFGQIDVNHHSNKDAHRDENEEQEWWIPISYATASNPDFSNAKRTHWLKPKENLTITGINPDDWVIVNKQQSGYYRVTYDAENWRKIAAYLRSENFTKIHVLNRAQIINDITALVAHDHIDPSVFLDVVTYLSREPDFAPWQSMFNFLDNLRTMLSYPSADPIKTFILSIMENLIKDVGFDELPNEDPLTTFKRMNTLEWACEFGHSTCREEITNKFLEHLKDPETNKIPQNLRSLMRTEGLRWANESVWNKLFEEAVEKEDRSLLQTLRFTENPALFAKYLNTAISNKTNIAPPIRKTMLRFDISCHLDVVFDFCLQNWEEITKFADIEDIREEIFYNTCSVHTKDQVEKIKKVCNLIEGEEKCNSSKYLNKKLSKIHYTENLIKEWVELITNK